MVKVFSRSINSRTFDFINKSNTKYAAELFGQKGYCVVPNFLSTGEVAGLKEKYSTEEHFHQLVSKDFHKMSARYFYHKKTWDQDEDIYKITRKVFHIKNQIALQPNSDQFMLSYCYRWGLDPTNMDELIDTQLNHTFTRLAKYKAGEGQHGHYDYPGELQCIIPLTELGLDYEEGGLVLGTEGEEQVHVDPLVKAGDLIILNAYHKFHAVRPVKCRVDQVGRMHLFIPTIPEYIFARGLGYYYFKEQKWKLHFCLPSLPPSLLLKIKYYTYHYLELVRNTSKPIDEGTKGSK